MARWSWLASSWTAPPRRASPPSSKRCGLLDQVLECVLVAGEVDYFLRIRVRDLAAFNRLHSERIIALPGVRQVRTFFVMNEIKTDGLLPV